MHNSVLKSQIFWLCCQTFAIFIFLLSLSKILFHSSRHLFVSHSVSPSNRCSLLCSNISYLVSIFLPHVFQLYNTIHVIRVHINLASTFILMFAVFHKLSHLASCLVSMANCFFTSLPLNKTIR